MQLDAPPANIVLDENDNKDIHDVEEETSKPLLAPFRHVGYKKTLNALRDALEEQSAAILKGVEGVGKTTLVNELRIEYQHRGIPVVEIKNSLTKTSQLYRQIAHLLGVAPEKKALISALRNTRDAGQFCLVILDQDAINSSVEVIDALKQLCKTSETIAGAIKLLVVCKDYLVIHAEGTTQGDFHDWIAQEVTLAPLHIDDIELFIYYLCALESRQPVAYEMGTDFIMIERTEGKIGRLKALLTPLIHNDVITRQDIIDPEEAEILKKANTKKRSLIALCAFLVIAVGLLVTQFIPFSGNTVTPPENIAVNDTINHTETSVFKEPEAETAANKDLSSNTQEIQGNSTSEIAAPDPETTDLVSPKLEAKNQPLDLDVDVDVDEQNLSQIPPESLQPPAAGQPLTAAELASLTGPEFQQAVLAKITTLETQLSAAVEENQRLQSALQDSEARFTETTNAIIRDQNTAQLADSSNTPQLPSKPIQSFTEQQAQPVLIAHQEKIQQTDGLDASPKDRLKIVTRAADAAIADHKQDVDVEDSTIKADSTRQKPVDEKPAGSNLNATNTLAINNRSENKKLEALDPALDPLFNTNVDKAIAAVDAWQQAWQNQAHLAYTNQYVDGFNGAFRSHSQWLKQREKALTKPDWIKVSNNGYFNIIERRSSIRIDFWLQYQASSGYADKTLKRLTLKEENGAWKITKEQNLRIELPY